jgi:hypothetical protein
VRPWRSATLSRLFAAITEHINLQHDMKRVNYPTLTNLNDNNYA